MCLCVSVSVFVFFSEFYVVATFYLCHCYQRLAISSPTFPLPFVSGISGVTELAPIIGDLDAALEGTVIDRIAADRPQNL